MRAQYNNSRKTAVFMLLNPTLCVMIVLTVGLEKATFMNQTLNLHPNATIDFSTALPLLRLLHPRRYVAVVWISFLVALALAYAALTFLGWPKWAATAVVLLAMLPIGILKWRDDYLRYGTTAMLLCILLVSQSAHTVEHLVQYAQYHWLYWTMRDSNGLLSPANAEWVHFVWNWLVLIFVVLLMRGGMRNWWMWLLLIVATGHTIEHSYTWIRYQMILAELRGMHIFNVTAQGLPGILGRDGLLARSEWTQGTFLCRIPYLTTAVRLDVHFWWNALEMGFLVPAGHVFLRNHYAEAEK